MNILLGCEESQECCIAFRKLGHEAYSCDLLPCSGGRPEWHLQMDIFEAIKLKKWDMAIFFPPCTFLTVSSNRWYKDQPPRKSGALVGKDRRLARKKAIKFFKDLYQSDIPMIAVENPVGIMSTVFRKPDQIIQPWMFGHPELKGTCLWLKNLPKLIITNNVRNDMMKLPRKDRQRIWWNGRSSKSRSKTFPGIAKAMAEQWGNVSPEYITRFF